MAAEDEEMIAVPVSSLAAIYICMRTMDHPDWITREARIERALATLPWPVKQKIIVAAAAALRRRVGTSEHG